MKAFLVICWALSLPGAFAALAFAQVGRGVAEGLLALLIGAVCFAGAAICESVDDLRKKLERWRLEDRPPAPQKPVPIAERPPIKI